MAKLGEFKKALEGKKILLVKGNLRQRYGSQWCNALLLHMDDGSVVHFPLSEPVQDESYLVEQEKREGACQGKVTN